MGDDVVWYWFFGSFPVADGAGWDSEEFAEGGLGYFEGCSLLDDALGEEHVVGTDVGELGVEGPSGGDGVLDFFDDDVSDFGAEVLPDLEGCGLGWWL